MTYCEAGEKAREVLVPVNAGTKQSIRKAESQSQFVTEVYVAEAESEGHQWKPAPS